MPASGSWGTGDGLTLGDGEGLIAGDGEGEGLGLAAAKTIVS